MVASTPGILYPGGMYIRRTTTRNTATGESYFTHRLVQSRRIGSKVRQETVLNLGRHFGISQDQWPTLCARIEDILSPQGELFSMECSASVEREAQRIANQILIRQKEQPTENKVTDDAPPDVQDIQVDSLEMVRPRTVGVEHVGLWAMGQVKFTEMLEEIGLTGPQRSAAIGSIIGRMAVPGSELSTYRWLCDRSGLGELLDVDFEAMSLMQLYRVSDLLMRHREKIEQKLFSRVSDLFGLSCTVTLYDLTNTYFEGEVQDNPKAQRGHSKEKRSDCNLLTLGLILDGSGFVRKSEIFAGNTAESSTLEKMLRGLGTPDGALVVMDRGVATEDNLTWLRDKGYRYIVVSRERGRHFNFEGATCIETASKEHVHIQKVMSDDSKEVRLYCHSEGRAKKETGIVKRFAERFEEGMKNLSEGLSRPRTTKKIEKIWERIGRLKEKSHGAGQHYKIEITPDESGKTAQAIRWEKNPVEGSILTHPGVYCLRSNEVNWNEEQFWKTYIMLTDLEAVFRSLKSELGMRPVFHQKEERSDGHLFITVLAYQFVQIIRRHLTENGIKDRWHSLRTDLSGQCRITTMFRRSDDRTVHVRKATKAEHQQTTIYQTLGIDASPGGVKKMII